MSEPSQQLPDGSIDVECSAGVWVLTLRGEHDLTTQPKLVEELELVEQANGPVVVDMSQATFIDSTVLGVLARHRRQATEPAVLAVVAPPSYHGSRMVELLGIGTAIPLYRTVREAIAALAS